MTTRNPRSLSIKQKWCQTDNIQLVGTYRGSENEHRQTYRNLLNPCLYKWDYILKLEDIEEESKWLFSEFNITEIHYPPAKVNVDSHLRFWNATIRWPRGHFLVSVIQYNLYCNRTHLTQNMAENFTSWRL